MAGLSIIEIILWSSTIIGGTLFVLRTIMMIVGIGAHADADLEMGDGMDSGLDGHYGHDMDMDHEGGALDPDFSFRLLSMQGLTAFFMMFGLVGLALLKAGIVTFFVLMGGLAAGLFAVWVISLLFAQIKHIRSQGNIDIDNAVGAAGTVYLNIPRSGSGQVRVPVQGALKIFDAVSESGYALKTGENIRVTGVVDSRTLKVIKQE